MTQSCILKALVLFEGMGSWEGVDSHSADLSFKNKNRIYIEKSSMIMYLRCY